MISVEVVYAMPDEQVALSVKSESPLTIRDAIEQSGILQQFPEIEVQEGRVGVFGYRQPLDYEVRDGDRVEIYRPLLLSPTEARKLRAQKKSSREN